MRILAVTLDQTRVTFHQWHYLTNGNLEHDCLAPQLRNLFSRLVTEEIGTLLGISRPKVSTPSIIGALGSDTERFAHGIRIPR